MHYNDNVYDSTQNVTEQPLAYPQEKGSYDHIHITSDNEVHVLVPFCNGDEMSRDNTCKTGDHFEAFFIGKAKHGEKGDNEYEAEILPAIDTIKKYLHDLDFDLDFLRRKPGKTTEDIATEKMKQKRHDQLRQYSDLLTQIIAEARRHSWYNAAQAVLPELQSGPDSNVYGIKLSPSSADPVLNFKAIFSVPAYERYTEGFTDTMLKAYAKANLGHTNALDQIKSAIKDTALDIITQKISKEEKGSNHLDIIKSALKTAIVQVLKIQDEASIDLNTLSAERYSEDAAGTVIKEFNQAYLKVVGLGYELSIDEIVDHGIHGCFSDNFFEEYAQLSLFEQSLNPKTDQSKLGKKPGNLTSLMVQFIFGLTNGFCAERADAFFGPEAESTKEYPNFGDVIDSYPHRELIANLVISTLKENGDIPTALLNYINQNTTAFSLRKKIAPDDIERIKEKFNTLFSVLIKAGCDHYDEFLLMFDKPGAFCKHQDKMAQHLWDVYAAYKRYIGHAGIAIDLEDFLAAKGRAFKSLPKPNNYLPGENEIVAGKPKAEKDKNPNVMHKAGDKAIIVLRTILAIFAFIPRLILSALRRENAPEGHFKKTIQWAKDFIHQVKRAESSEPNSNPKSDVPTDRDPPKTFNEPTQPPYSAPDASADAELARQLQAEFDAEANPPPGNGRNRNW